MEEERNCMLVVIAKVKGQTNHRKSTTGQKDTKYLT